MIIDHLPARNTPAERVATIAADVRDVAAKMKAALEERAGHYQVNGWEIIVDSFDIALVPDSDTLVGRVRMERLD